MMRSFRLRNIQVTLFAALLLIGLIALVFFDAHPSSVAAGKNPNAGSTIYLPIVQSGVVIQPASNTRRIDAPYYNTLWFGGAAIAWFGKISESENYADTRVEYTDTDLFVRVTVFDRRIWCNTNGSAADPTVWDAVSVYLDTNSNVGSSLDTNAYRFTSQFTQAIGCVNGTWSPAYRWNGSTWAVANVPYVLDNWYRGDDPGPNHDTDNHGWVMTFQIPFSSLGLSKPTQGTRWRLGVVVHDRDSFAGPPNANKFWPETLNVSQPNTWGQLFFGLPTAYVPPATTPGSIVTIRHGLNSAVVPDGHVGGSMVCGSGLDPWLQWGNQNYVGQNQINIQNQEDVSDWPCFSKYYVTFPLDQLPTGKAIISSTLTMYLFGNSGQGWTPGPYRSLIQVYAVNENWSENTLTWNNAPLAGDYVAETYVDPVDTVPPWPGIPYTWDVSAAVAKAYAAGQPVRLVLYSADNPMHSGKYFYSSDASPEGRPALRVRWGTP